MKGLNGLVVAPHFRHAGHLGGIRVGRFRAWASGEGRRIDVIRAGSTDDVIEDLRGRIVTVRDPFGFYRDPKEVPGDGVPPSPRRRNLVRRVIAYLLFVPDPMMFWGRRVLRSPLCEDLPQPSWVLASSPPESSLVIARRIAERKRARLILDLRDGWMDESMIPLIGCTIQKYRQLRHERRTLRRASTIIVNSEGWKDAISLRYPDLESRITVLPNGCPDDFPSPAAFPAGEAPLRLMYAGRISSSRPERDTGELMRFLSTHLEGTGHLVFRGNFQVDEIRILESFRSGISDRGWVLEVLPPVSRRLLWEEFGRCHGLVLYSPSRASIPAKFFDYIGAGMPILALTPSESALSRLSGEVPQLFPVDPVREGRGVPEFLDACRRGCPARIPDIFREEKLKEQFLKLLRRVEENPE